MDRSSDWPGTASTRVGLEESRRGIQRKVGSKLDGESCSPRTCLGVIKIIRFLAASITGSVKWVSQEGSHMEDKAHLLHFFKEKPKRTTRHLFTEYANLSSLTPLQPGDPGYKELM